MSSVVDGLCSFACMSQPESDEGTFRLGNIVRLLREYAQLGSIEVTGPMIGEYSAEIIRVCQGAVFLLVTVRHTWNGASELKTHRFELDEKHASLMRGEWVDSESTEICFSGGFVMPEFKARSNGDFVIVPKNMEYRAKKGKRLLSGSVKEIRVYTGRAEVVLSGLPGWFVTPSFTWVE